MKKVSILIILGVFVLLAGTAQPAQAAMLGSWAPSVRSVITSDPGSKPGESFIRGLAQLDAAASKFEGVLNAYSANQNQKIEEQLSAAARDLSDSLEEFNVALIEVYPNLSEEGELAFREAYSSTESYFEDLTAGANAVFGRETFRIEVENIEPFGRFITIIDDLNSDP